MISSLGALALCTVLAWTGLDTYYSKIAGPSKPLSDPSVSSLVNIEHLYFSQLSSLDFHAAHVVYLDQIRTWNFSDISFLDPTYGLCQSQDMLYDQEKEVLIFPKGLNFEQSGHSALPLQGQILFATYCLKTQEWDFSEQTWSISDKIQ